MIAVCPCCNTPLKDCPFCGKPARIYGEGIVGCIDTVVCGGQMDFGHFSGVGDDGIPAVHWVIDQWNKRSSPSREILVDLAHELDGVLADRGSGMDTVNVHTITSCINALRAAARPLQGTDNDH